MLIGGDYKVQPQPVRCASHRVEIVQNISFAIVSVSKRTWLPSQCKHKTEKMHFSVYYLAKRLLPLLHRHLWLSLSTQSLHSKSKEQGGGEWKMQFKTHRLKCSRHPWYCCQISVWLPAVDRQRASSSRRMFDISNGGRDGSMATEDRSQVSLLKISPKLTIQSGTKRIECPATACAAKGKRQKKSK